MAAATIAEEEEEEGGGGNYPSVVLRREIASLYNDTMCV